MAALAAKYRLRVNQQALASHAANLGVEIEALRRLGIGWDGTAWTFPMRAPDGHIIGIRRRFANGKKLSVRGGREGLFLPDGVNRSSGLVLIAEGPTDAAALLSLGFECVGRPSCRGGTRMICAVARGRDVVIVADGDRAGRLGAEALATILTLFCARVRIIRPPLAVKDAREWLRRGATASDIWAAIGAAEIVRISIESSGFTKKKPAL